MLSKEDINNFVRDGYCVINIDLPDAAVKQAKELVWEFTPSSFIPAEKDSWTGVVDDSCMRQSMDDRNGRLKYRDCTRGFRSMRALTYFNKELLKSVKSLIKSDTGILKDKRFMPIYRGIYPIFSQNSLKENVSFSSIYKGVNSIFSKNSFDDSIKGHCDTHFFQVGSVIYLNDVEVGGGAFTVWPGSHHAIAPHATGLSHTHKPEGFDQLCEQVQRSIKPVQITGKQGTVVLWHHRLLHSAGLNNSGGVRYAMLCDFKNGMAEEKSHEKISRQAFDETWSPEVLTQYKEILVRPISLQA